MGLFSWLSRNRRSPVLEAVSALLPEPPSPRLAAAIETLAREVTDKRLGRRLASLRPHLILIFARQAEDAGRKLSDSYWTSDRGHNVGQDVFAAYGAALRAVLAVLDRRPRSRTPLLDAVTAVEALMPALRIEPADPDGYGLATLHEIRRDLASLL